MCPSTINPQLSTLNSSMSGSANVQSSDAIEAVKAALVFFKNQVEQALTTNDLEMRRVLDWLEHDRPRYWKTRVRVAHDEVTAAKAALTRCLMYPINDERPSCYEERAAVKKAEAQYAYCREKAERLRHWTREIRHEMFEYEGRISQTVELMEIDVPTAIGVLNKLMGRLEEYQSTRPRADVPAANPGPPTEDLSVDGVGESP
jgi:hypothetical protein